MRVLIADDSTLDHFHATKIELVHRHWSGKHKRVVRGINLISLVWSDGDRSTPATDPFTSTTAPTCLGTGSNSATKWSSSARNFSKNFSRCPPVFSSPAAALNSPIAGHSRWKLFSSRAGCAARRSAAGSSISSCCPSAM